MVVSTAARLSFPGGSACVKVEFRRAGGDARRTILSDVFQRKRKSPVEVADARAVETCLNDHDFLSWEYGAPPSPLPASCTTVCAYFDEDVGYY
jgi:hypothetical protein